MKTNSERDQVQEYSYEAEFVTWQYDSFNSARQKSDSYPLVI